MEEQDTVALSVVLLYRNNGIYFQFRYLEFSDDRAFCLERGISQLFPSQEGLQEIHTAYSSSQSLTHPKGQAADLTGQSTAAMRIPCTHGHGTCTDLHMNTSHISNNWVCDKDCPTPFSLPELKVPLNAQMGWAGTLTSMERGLAVSHSMRKDKENCFGLRPKPQSLKHTRSQVTCPV